MRLRRFAAQIRNCQKGLLLGVLALAMSFGYSACRANSNAPGSASSPLPSELSTQPASPQANNMRINIKAGNQVVTATLIDSPTTRDFISLLPLTLTLEDYASTEKISNLPRKLSTEAAPPGSDPAVGDIAYYAPWGNLAIYYRDFVYSNGLVMLGKVDSGLEVLNVSDSIEVTIEKIQ